MGKTRSYWDTCVDTDHALICAYMALRFSGKRRMTGSQTTFHFHIAQQTNTLRTQLDHQLQQENVAVEIECFWENIRNPMKLAEFSACKTVQ